MMKNLSLLLVFAFASLLFSCSDKQESNSDKEENNTENKKMQSMPEECNSSQLSFSATVNDSLIEVQNFEINTVEISETMGMEFTINEGSDLELIIFIQASGKNPPEIEVGKKYGTIYEQGDHIWAHYRLKTPEGSSYFVMGQNGAESSGYAEVLYLTKDRVCCVFAIHAALGPYLKGTLSASRK